MEMEFLYEYNLRINNRKMEELSKMGNGSIYDYFAAVYLTQGLLTRGIGAIFQFDIKKTLDEGFMILETNEVLSIEDKAYIISQGRQLGVTAVEFIASDDENYIDGE